MHLNWMFHEMLTHTASPLCVIISETSYFLCIKSYLIKGKHINFPRLISELVIGNVNRYIVDCY